MSASTDRTARHRDPGDHDWEASPRGATDLGADRDTRRKPCTRQTWCIRELNHADGCEVVAGAPAAKSDFGPQHVKLHGKDVAK